MPYRKGTLVTQYQELDEYTGSGERTCEGYKLDVSDEPDMSNICIGMVANVNEKGILVCWVRMCILHNMHMNPLNGVLVWHQNGELWEIGQLA